MEIVTIGVEGTFALLCHNPAGMAQTVADKVGKKRVWVPADEAEGATYRNAEGCLSLPCSAFRGCVLSAATGRRIGKDFATTVVKGALFAADDLTVLTLPGGEPLTEYEIDTRRVVVKKQSVMHSRAKMPKWAAAIRFELDQEFLTEANLRELLAIGGKTVGVGDYRPAKGGPFGRFRVLDSPD